MRADSPVLPAWLAALEERAPDLVPPFVATAGMAATLTTPEADRP